MKVLFYITCAIIGYLMALLSYVTAGWVGIAVFATAIAFTVYLANKPVPA